MGSGCSLILVGNYIAEAMCVRFFIFLDCMTREGFVDQVVGLQPFAKLHKYGLGTESFLTKS